MGAYNVVSSAAMVAGQPEDISIVLANFNAIATVLNGGIDNSNINAAAAILASKLAGYPADATRALKGDGTWGQIIDAMVAAGAGIGRPKLERNVTDLALLNPIVTATGITSIIAWDIENADDQNQHAPGGSTITLARSGLYLINFVMSWANVPGGDRLSQIFVNGINLAQATNPRDGIFGTAAQNVSLVHLGVAGDVIDARVVQNSGGNINTGSAGPVRFSVVQL